MNKRILVVDDDQNISMLLQLQLAKAGYDVITASSGLLALDLIETQKPDLILLDLMLPDMDGAEVCRRLRAIETMVPVIMLTAYTGPKSMKTAVEAGIDDYIEKPFRKDELLMRIKSHLDRVEMVPVSLSILGDQPM